MGATNKLYDITTIICYILEGKWKTNHRRETIGLRRLRMQTSNYYQCEETLLLRFSFSIIVSSKQKMTAKLSFAMLLKWAEFSFSGYNFITEKSYTLQVIVNTYFLNFFNSVWKNAFFYSFSDVYKEIFQVMYYGRY